MLHMARLVASTCLRRGVVRMLFFQSWKTSGHLWTLGGRFLSHRYAPSLADHANTKTVAANLLPNRIVERCCDVIKWLVTTAAGAPMVLNASTALDVPLIASSVPTACVRIATRMAAPTWWVIIGLYPGLGLKKPVLSRQPFFHNQTRCPPS